MTCRGSSPAQAGRIAADAVALTTVATLLLVAGVIGLSVLAIVPAAWAQTTTRCSEIFPDVEWVAAGSDVIDIGLSEVTPGRAERFVREVESTAAAVSSEMGGLTSAAVCIVAGDSTFVADRYLEPTKRFHAVLDHERDVLVLSAENPGNILRASAFGIPHLALWNLSDGEGWPEPLASTIGQWYRARALDRMDQYRVQSTGADFSVDPITGEGNFGLDFSTDARIDWDASIQPAVRAWDPARNEAPIGYLVEYTVANEGVVVLSDTDAETWSAREVRWRESLVVDLTGRTEPTTGWISGGSIAIGLVFLAGILAVGGYVLKRRQRRRPGRGAS